MIRQWLVLLITASAVSVCYLSYRTFTILVGVLGFGIDLTKLDYLIPVITLAAGLTSGVIAVGLLIKLRNPESSRAKSIVACALALVTMCCAALVARVRL